MVKRVVDTKFWTSMDVIDNYSVEDKFFALYLMTNARSSQVGIYSLPKKVISFETGFTTDVIQVLLDRFSQKYGQIIYSNETQEVTVLRSLEYSILKGGKPVSDLLERELREIKDGRLILTTYQLMKEFWESSKRRFDQTIQSIFEAELISRELILAENENVNQNEKNNDNDIHSNNESKNHNHNDNDNEESSGTNRGMNQDTNRKILINTDETNPDELVALEKYVEYLKYKKPAFDKKIKSEEILSVFYQELLGEVTLAVQEKIACWEEKFPKSLILESFVRSIDKFRPLPYVNSIIDNWEKEGVESFRDISRLDRKYNHKKN